MLPESPFINIFEWFKNIFPNWNLFTVYPWHLHKKPSSAKIYLIWIWKQYDRLFAGRNGKSTTITLFITGSSVCLIDYSWDLPMCGVMANCRTRRNQSLFKFSGIFVLLWICPESSKKCKYHIFCPYVAVIRIDLSVESFIKPQLKVFKAILFEFLFR